MLLESTNMIWALIAFVRSPSICRMLSVQSTHDCVSKDLCDDACGSNSINLPVPTGDEDLSMFRDIRKVKDPIHKHVIPEPLEGEDSPGHGEEAGTTGIFDC